MVEKRTPNDIDFAGSRPEQFRGEPPKRKRQMPDRPDKDNRTWSDTMNLLFPDAHDARNKVSQ